VILEACEWAACVILGGMCGQYLVGPRKKSDPKEEWQPRGWHNGRTKPKDRPYECLCLHLPTSHERIEFMRDGQLYVKFGKCTARTENNNCICTGYMGPLPVEMSPFMVIHDNEPIVGVSDQTKQAISEIVGHNIAQIDKISESAEKEVKKLGASAENAIHMASTGTAAQIRREVEASNAKEIARWERTHHRVHPNPPDDLTESENQFRDWVDANLHRY
jgi:hypothetical protein